MSPEMTQFINLHPTLFVSRKLHELRFTSSATDTINFLSPKGLDDVIFSKDIPGKNPTKIGRMVRKLLIDNHYNVSDTDIELFVNY